MSQDQPKRWARSGAAALYDRADQLTILCADGAVRRLDDASAELARTILEALARPCTLEEIEQDVAEHFELDSGGGTAIVSQLVEQLHAWGAIEPFATARPQRASDSASEPAAARRLVLGVCGAVRTAFTPSLVSALLARGFEVQVVATDDAARFITAEAIEVLTHKRLLGSMWQRDEPGSVPHIELARWADLMIIAPASATTLSRLAAGDFSSLVAAIALATRAPVVLCPSMNERMRSTPAVQRNLQQLADDGFVMVHPRWSYEVADAPHARERMMGGAPTAQRIADLAAHIASELPSRAATTTTGAATTGAATNGAATTVAEWDALFSSDAAPPSWQTDALDADIAEALDSTPPPARLLDVGSGTGTVAIEAARRGYQAVALDISSAALARARQRDQASRVLWLRGDITECPIDGTRFEIIVDRGCLHCLAPTDQPRYARSVAELLADEGMLLLKVHEAGPDNPYRTTPFDAETLRALFSPAGLELQSCQPASLGPDAPALLARLVRAGAKKSSATT
ncbi:MAG: methyltransferase domain-containing protein [Myxococcales bacterium]|nr:methyltransferase domain-containing protein [Myxococcales bacterium]